MVCEAKLVGPRTTYIGPPLDSPLICHYVVHNLNNVLACKRRVFANGVVEIKKGYFLASK